MTPPGPPPTKSSWPLFTLAALSFTPGLGFIIGAIAVTWALLSDRPRAKLALGIGAAGAFLNVAGAILFNLWMQKNPMVQQAQAQLARKDLVELVAAIDTYHDRNGRYPSTLQALVGYPVPTTLLNIQDQSGGLAGMRPYQYSISADSTSFDIYGVGPDRKPGTSDDVRPGPPDSLSSHTGYHPLPH